jgi:NADH:ubiquinone oxidoreductase subunit E
VTNLNRRQIFVCINNRHEKSPSCGYSGSEEIVEELRKASKELNLKGKLRVARSDCLDLCAFGPNLMIWPEGIWYMQGDQRRRPAERRHLHET